MSSVFIGIIGALLPYFSFLLYGIDVDFSLLLSAYLLTFTVYSVDKLSNIKEDSINLTKRADFIGRHKRIITYATAFSYATALTLSFLKNLLTIFVILFPICMGLVYSIKISNFRLKDILAVKNITIAISWAVMGTFLPISVSSKSFMLIALVFYFIFIKCVVNTVIFDIRDIKGDRISGVKTIPVFLGRNKTKILLLALNSTLIPWLIFSYFEGFFHKYIFVLIFAIFYGYLYILHFCREDIKIGKSLDLLVDGEWIPTVILALILA